MRELCEILIVGFCLWLAWTALAPRPVFKVRFAKGALRVTRGKVTADFEQQIGEDARVILYCLGTVTGWLGLDQLLAVWASVRGIHPPGVLCLAPPTQLTISACRGLWPPWPRISSTAIT